MNEEQILKEANEITELLYSAKRFILYGDCELALKALKDFLDLNPGSSEAYFLRGSLKSF
jgi:hypothetical protein